jgi:hypothetical protein
MSRARISLFLVALIGCAQPALALGAIAGPHDALIAKHAAANGVPESLVRRIIQVESRGNPRVVSQGNYGLMQIRLGTARAMGYSGTAQGLLDPDTNMAYGVKYLAGAYRTAGCNENRAVSYYQRGYYGVAKARCRLPQPSLVRVARAETNAVALPADVLKPKVVQTESIAKPNPAMVPSQTVVKAGPAFNPTRSASKSGPDMATTPAIAKLEPEAAPLPPAKPELKPEARLNMPPARKRTSAGKQAGAPTNLLSFLKKLVTPENKPQRRRSRAQLQAPY